MWRSANLRATHDCHVVAMSWLARQQRLRGHHPSQRRLTSTAQGAVRQFGQDRISSTGELLTAAPPPAPERQPAAQQPGAGHAPEAPPLTGSQLERLAELVHSSRRLLVLTGAGCSTESDIPDYRGPNGAYSTGFKPMTHQQFMASQENRSRYWARSFAGWLRFARVVPNAAHEGIARLQRTGWARGGLITQNVDRLHSRAGSPEVLELHGTTHEVVCMGCGRLSCRHEFQELLAGLNPEAAAAAAALEAGRDAARRARQDALRMLRQGTAAPLGPALQEHDSPHQPEGIGIGTAAAAAASAAPSLRFLPDGEVELASNPRPRHPNATTCDSSGGPAAAPAAAPEPPRALQQRPDGDAELDPASLAGGRFVVPPCAACGGVLKPNVVFFGDQIPRERAARSLALAGAADAVLVVGSSLQVYSAFRLAQASKRAGARLAILTAGPTRADGLLGEGDVKFEVLAGAALSRLAAHPFLQVPPVC